VIPVIASHVVLPFGVFVRLAVIFIVQIVPLVKFISPRIELVPVRADTPVVVVQTFGAATGGVLFGLTETLNRISEFAMHGSLLKEKREGNFLRVFLIQAITFSPPSRFDYTIIIGTVKRKNEEKNKIVVNPYSVRSYDARRRAAPLQ
jgi:hypothetical protein